MYYRVLSKGKKLISLVSVIHSNELFNRYWETKNSKGHWSIIQLPTTGGRYNPSY